MQTFLGGVHLSRCPSVGTGSEPDGSGFLIKTLAPANPGIGPRRVRLLEAPSQAARTVQGVSERPTTNSTRIERVRIAARCMIEGQHDLDLIADSVHCGRRQLVRDFQELIGCPPVSFRAAVRTQRARDELLGSSDVLRAVYASGFSSPSQFYESVPQTLGMSPSKYSRGAPDVSVLYSIFESPHGSILVAATDVGLCSVNIGTDHESLISRLTSEFPLAVVERDDSALVGAVTAVRSMLLGSILPGQLPIDVRGTAFQRKVWDALRRIPPGTTVSYTELANNVGEARAVRAVANACGQNPLAIVIPCHRAVRSDGTIGGYRWGIEMKTGLLETERVLWS